MESNPVGRPTKYKDEYNEQVEKLCKLGATDKEIADFFDVDESTINNWKSTYPEFLVSIKKGKDLADANVADSLYKRATGYQHEDTYFSNFQGMVSATPYTKHYPPDPTSMIFWLKNRRKAQWRDSQNIDLTSKDKELNNNLSHLSFEDLIKLRDGNTSGDQSGDSAP
jgi:hypothetical protein